MARARTLKPQFFRSEQVNALDPWGRLLFEGLWTLADRRGILEDRPKQIKYEIFPADEVDVDRLLNEIQTQALIQRYSAEGRNCIWITGFVSNQNPHPREPENGLPLPAAERNGQPLKNMAGNAHSPLPIPHSPLPLSSSKTCGEPAVADSSPPDCSFPVFPTAAGRRTDSRTWTLPGALVSEWAEAFPAVDVPAECRRAHAWVKANLGRRKTSSGMPAFLHRWMTKAQNIGGGRPSPNGATKVPQKSPKRAVIFGEV